MVGAATEVSLGFPQTNGAIGSGAASDFEILDGKKLIKALLVRACQLWLSNMLVFGYAKIYDGRRDE